MEMLPEINYRIDQIHRAEVPEGWRSVPLGSLGEVKNGLNYHKESLGFDVNILGVGDFKERSILTDTSNLQAVSLSTKPDDDYFLKDGDIVFVRSNGSKELVGRNLLMYPRKNLVTYSGFCIRFRMIPNAVTTPEYINLFLDNGALKRQLKKENQGSNINNLNQNILSKLVILLPTINEQQKIVEILTTQNKIIELKEKLIAEKQRQKKYLMQQLLTGKRRLSGFNSEWRSLRLKQVTSRIKRKNTVEADNVLTISVQYGLISQSEFFNKQIASDDKSNYYLLYRNDFAYNKSYSAGYPYGAIKPLKKYDIGIVSPLYICFSITDKNISNTYMEHFFEAGLLNREIQAYAQEGARNHGLLNISVDDFFNAKILLPPYEEQQAIAEILSTADQEIALLQQSLEQEKQNKKALMQLLLTGIVRVNV